ncbi:bifunctional 5,10-methylenetetrahydrofolate dehydrogenase/5,10-methenyltetrahydrofolate cyclohydrolase [Candidatus Parcubacteria bacterium]|nr:bifunctional 5,10-methylenetetrahydrofolate dehydrogenase/5,10-methenyltetrahydrofolate cyclohydrolase [Candidatus Parcubacteria bacterium]
MAQILDGKIVAQKIRVQIESEVSAMAQAGKQVKLAIVLASEDPSSMSYVNAIVRASEKVGVITQIEKPSDINQSNLELIVANLAQDTGTHGIILQTPLPEEVNVDKLSSLIPPKKDVDGLNPLNAGRLALGLDCFAPATAQAVMEILNYYDIELSGKNTVVIGRSNTVGKPVAQLLLKRNATVSVCHSKTKNISQFSNAADILVTAIGKSKLITSEFVHENLTIIDVGTNFDSSGKMTGDVDFEGVEPIVKAITPVPGGVGPVTTAVLLKHTCESAMKSL